MQNGNQIGKVWQLVLDRLPEGWGIYKVAFSPKSGRRMESSADGSITAGRALPWVVKAGPLANFAQKTARIEHLDGLSASGGSVLEALITLAVRAERGIDRKSETSSEATAHSAAVDALFKALFP